MWVCGSRRRGPGAGLSHSLHPVADPAVACSGTQLEQLEMLAKAGSIPPGAEQHVALLQAALAQQAAIAAAARQQQQQQQQFAQQAQAPVSPGAGLQAPARTPVAPPPGAVTTDASQVLVPPQARQAASLPAEARQAHAAGAATGQESDAQRRDSHADTAPHTALAAEPATASGQRAAEDPTMSEAPAASTVEAMATDAPPAGAGADGARQAPTQPAHAPSSFLGLLGEAIGGEEGAALAAPQADAAPETSAPQQGLRPVIEDRAGTSGAADATPSADAADAGARPSQPSTALPPLVGTGPFSGVPVGSAGSSPARLSAGGPPGSPQDVARVASLSGWIAPPVPAMGLQPKIMEDSTQPAHGEPAMREQ